MSLIDKIRSLGGGMLTGWEITKQIAKGNIEISPFDPKCVNPNSYNLKLHPELLVYKRGSNRYDVTGIPEGYLDDLSLAQLKVVQDENIKNNTPLDMKTANETISLTIPKEGLVLQPGVLYIGRTVERTATDKFIPMINGRSSGGRLGISPHVCAGFGDVGFDGTWTLEITVVEPVRVYPNEEIAQICYFKPFGLIKNLYKGRYQNQENATASRFHLPKKG